MRYLLMAVIFLIVLLVLFTEIIQNRRQKDNLAASPVRRFFKLSDDDLVHSQSLKQQFFRERFKDLQGAEITIGGFIGTPVVLLMLPSFRTRSGHESLLALEKVRRNRQGQFQAVVIPIEGAETIKPAIKKDPKDMWFLFRANGKANSTLIDSYADLFWDEEIMKVDYPSDRPEKHRTSPFFWIIDENSVVRAKLIDYSGKANIKAEDIEIVLESLLGPSESMPQLNDVSVSDKSNVSSSVGDLDK